MQAGRAVGVDIHLGGDRIQVEGSTFVQVVDPDLVQDPDRADQAVAVVVAGIHLVPAAMETSSPADGTAVAAAAVGMDVAIDIAYSADDRVDVDPEEDVIVVC